MFLLIMIKLMALTACYLLSIIWSTMVTILHILLYTPRFLWKHHHMLIMVFLDLWLVLFPFRTLTTIAQTGPLCSNLHSRQWLDPLCYFPYAPPAPIEPMMIKSIDIGLAVSPFDRGGNATEPIKDLLQEKAADIVRVERFLDLGRDANTKAVDWVPGGGHNLAERLGRIGRLLKSFLVALFDSRLYAHTDECPFYVT